MTYFTGEYEKVRDLNGEGGRGHSWICWTKVSTFHFFLISFLIVYVKVMYFLLRAVVQVPLVVPKLSLATDLQATLASKRKNNGSRGGGGRGGRGRVSA